MTLTTDERIAESAAAKKEGMDRVDDNANRAWKAQMGHAVLHVSVKMRTYTSDDVFDWVETNLGAAAYVTHDLRAFGPVMLNAVKAGLCRKANLPHRASRRKSLHASPRQVWESLVFGQEELL